MPQMQEEVLADRKVPKGLSKVSRDNKASLRYRSWYRKNRAYKLRYMKMWEVANAYARQRYQEEYKAQNRASIRKVALKRYWRDPQKERDRSRAWYNANKDAINERRRFRTVQRGKRRRAENGNPD